MACAIIIILNWTTNDTISIIKEVDITKWESLGFHVRINFTTWLVKFLNIYNIPHPTKLSK